MRSRIHILSYFSIGELFILFLGKLFGEAVSKKYKDLQDRENKLTILHRCANIVDTVNNDAIVSFALADKTYKCQLRLRGSDVWVFNQVIAGNEYQHVLSHYSNAFKALPATMIDAGANIGLTTILFKSVNPQAKIVAIEPDESNHSMARRNIGLNSLNNINLVKAALWPVPVKLEVINDFRDKMDWSLRVQESEDGNTESITPLQAIYEVGGVVDILKMDVEGGEAQIFDSQYDLDWLTRVKVLAIEIHDEYDIRSNIVGHLLKHNFEISNHGELTIGINKNLLDLHQRTSENR
jgi:FkbM family methyltransferase